MKWLYSLCMDEKTHFVSILPWQPQRCWWYSAACSSDAIWHKSSYFFLQCAIFAPSKTCNRDSKNERRGVSWWTRPNKGFFYRGFLQAVQQVMVLALEGRVGGLPHQGLSCLLGSLRTDRVKKEKMNLCRREGFRLCIGTIFRQQPGDVVERTEQSTEGRDADL